MLVFHRLLTGLLALALAHFGVLATAPAHAHEEGAGHGVREMVLAHGHADVEQGDVGHHHDDHHAPDLNGAEDQPAPGSPGAGHGEHAHVHAFPQFTPGDASDAASRPVFAPYAPWPLISVAAPSNSSFPPLRPPRAIL